MFQNRTQIVKKQVILLKISNGRKCKAKSKGREAKSMALSCSKKAISIIKWNNIKTLW